MKKLGRLCIDLMTLFILAVGGIEIVRGFIKNFDTSLLFLGFTLLGMEFLWADIYDKYRDWLDSISAHKRLIYYIIYLVNAILAFSFGLITLIHPPATFMFGDKVFYLFMMTVIIVSPGFAINGIRYSLMFIRDEREILKYRIKTRKK